MNITEKAQPLLSVVIPIFNGEKHIGEMLDSIIVQTYDNWNLFIVDDGSTDATLQIIQDYAEKESRITPLRRDRTPKGGQTCRNIGFEHSIGAKYIIFFDADDIIAPYCFEQRVEYMENHPQLDFSIFPARTFVNSIDNNRGTYYGYKFLDECDLVTFLSYRVPFVVWNNIYKRESLERKKIHWDENVLSFQDADFNIQSILNGLVYEYANNARIDYYYRIGQSGTVCEKINSERHQMSHYYLINKVINSLNDHQQQIYRLALIAYIIRFTNRFALFKKDELFYKLIENSFIKNNKWLRIRLITYYKLTCKFPNLHFNLFFFPVITHVYKEKFKKDTSQSHILKKMEAQNAI